MSSSKDPKGSQPKNTTNADPLKGRFLSSELDDIFDGLETPSLPKKKSNPAKPLDLTAGAKSTSTAAAGPAKTSPAKKKSPTTDDFAAYKASDSGVFQTFKSPETEKRTASKDKLKTIPAPPTGAKTQNKRAKSSPRIQSLRTNSSSSLPSVENANTGKLASKPAEATDTPSKMSAAERLRTATQEGQERKSTPSAKSKSPEAMPTSPTASQPPEKKTQTPEDPKPTAKSGVANAGAAHAKGKGAATVPAKLTPTDSPPTSRKGEESKKSGTSSADVKTSRSPSTGGIQPLTEEQLKRASVGKSSAELASLKTWEKMNQSGGRTSSGPSSSWQSVLIYGVIFFAGIIIAQFFATDMQVYRNRLRGLEQGQTTNQKELASAQAVLRKEKADLVSVQKLKSELGATKKALVATQSQLQSFQTKMQTLLKRLRSQDKKQVTMIVAVRGKVQGLEDKALPALRVDTSRLKTGLSTLGGKVQGHKEQLSALESSGKRRQGVIAELATGQKAYGKQLKILAAQSKRVGTGLLQANEGTKALSLQMTNRLNVVTKQIQTLNRGVVALKKHKLQQDKSLKAAQVGLAGLHRGLGKTKARTKVLETSSSTQDWILKRAVAALKSLPHRIGKLEKVQNHIAKSFGEVQTKSKANAWLLARTASTLPQLTDRVKTFQKNQQLFQKQNNQLAMALNRVRKKQKQFQQAWVGLSKQNTGTNKALGDLGGKLATLEKYTKQSKAVQKTQSKNLEGVLGSLGALQNQLNLLRKQAQFTNARQKQLVGVMRGTPTREALQGIGKSVVRLQKQWKSLKQSTGQNQKQWMALVPTIQSLQKQMAIVQKNRGKASSQELNQVRVALAKFQKATITSFQEVQSNLNGLQKQQRALPGKLVKQVTTLQTQIQSLKKQGKVKVDQVNSLQKTVAILSTELEKLKQAISKK